MSKLDDIIDNCSVTVGESHRVKDEFKALMLELIDNNKKNLRVSPQQMNGILTYEGQLRKKVEEL